jgi:putative transcriptional regulator
LFHLLNRFTSFTFIEDFKMELKNNLKEIRQKNELTQQQLASSVDVSRQTIISIERYRYKPSLELAMKIAKKLNINIEKLFYFE